MEKIPAELLAITYGALVRQMFVDHNENAEVINQQLDALGERIGVRLIEEYAARSGAPPCTNFATAAESCGRIGLKMFLGVNANVENAGDGLFSISFDDNPLNMFVDLPPALRGQLWYSNVLCGVVRGAMGQVGMRTEVSFVRDVLRGDDTNELRIRFKGKEKDPFRVDTNK
jgi:hypothetical protein